MEVYVAMIWLEISPTLLSIVLLLSIQIRKGSYWESKVRNQMRRFTDIDANAIVQIEEIADDISTSTGFVSSTLAILFGIALIVAKESIVDNMFPFRTIEGRLLLLLAIIYVGALAKLYSMRDILLSRKCRTPPLDRFSYATVFTGLLCLGYVINIYVAIN